MKKRNTSPLGMHNGLTVVLTSLTSDHLPLIQTSSHGVNARPHPKMYRALFTALQKPNQNHKRGTRYFITCINNQFNELMNYHFTHKMVQYKSSNIYCNYYYGDLFLLPRLRYDRWRWCGPLSLGVLWDSDWCPTGKLSEIKEISNHTSYTFHFYS